MSSDLVQFVDCLCWRSLVRESICSDYRRWDYPQMGVVATLKIGSSSGENTTAWQRFLPSGPVALLPLGPTASSLVWTVPKAELQALLNMKEEVLIFSPLCIKKHEKQGCEHKCVPKHGEWVGDGLLNSVGLGNSARTVVVHSCRSQFFK